MLVKTLLSLAVGLGLVSAAPTEPNVRSADSASSRPKPPTPATPLNVLLVHGAWGGAQHWSHVILELKKLGHGLDGLQAVDIPLSSFEEDVTRVKQASPAQTATSFSSDTRTAHDKVKGLVYVAAFAPDAGESVGYVAALNPSEGLGNTFVDAAGYTWLNKTLFRQSFAQDVKENEAWHMAVEQKAPMGTVLAGNVTDPAWRHKPSYYQVSADDHLLSPVTQRFLADRMNTTRTIVLDSSHASLVSKARNVAKLSTPLVLVRSS